jgi:hypothetical protein
MTSSNPAIALLNLPLEAPAREEALVFRVLQLQHRLDGFVKDNRLLKEQNALLKAQFEQFKENLIVQDEYVRLDRQDKNRERLRLGLQCIRGHPLTEENTCWYGGRRFCRACQRVHRQTYQNNKALKAECQALRERLAKYARHADGQ